MYITTGMKPCWFTLEINTFSWGSGANPWGLEKDDKFSKPNHWDGMLEVVGVTGMVHLGQIQSGLRSAIRIAQVVFIHSLFKEVADVVFRDPQFIEWHV